MSDEDKLFKDIEEAQLCLVPVVSALIATYGDAVTLGTLLMAAANYTVDLADSEEDHEKSVDLLRQFMKGLADVDVDDWHKETEH